jgi:deferrochelatase/peroxidase EfeB
LLKEQAMPLNLEENEKPIDSTDPQYQDVLEDLQGNILKGHGRNKSVHIFLTFPKVEGNPEKIGALKNWIAQLAINEITSANTNVQFSFSGTLMPTTVVLEVIKQIDGKLPLKQKLLNAPK